jgi:hypothetical protein
VLIILAGEYSFDYYGNPIEFRGRRAACAMVAISAYEINLIGTTLDSSGNGSGEYLSELFV